MAHVCASCLPSEESYAFIAINISPQLIRWPPYTPKAAYNSRCSLTNCVFNTQLVRLPLEAVKLNTNRKCSTCVTGALVRWLCYTSSNSLLGMKSLG